ncbi:hypothetical protein JG688_00011552 [Phytophthora aleatoria]|uniref:Uncharacterized protein n=1 Tax=Phytophthora aleatoria TaxID=2496075 RepID=A0A8J5IP26_9STRA|nr:hypothetical protein JG688_00011552 [Phytophthora aleatoria]
MTIHRRISQVVATPDKLFERSHSTIGLSTAKTDFVCNAGWLVPVSQRLTILALVFRSLATFLYLRNQAACTRCRPSTTEVNHFASPALHAQVALAFQIRKTTSSISSSDDRTKWSRSFMLPHPSRQLALSNSTQQQHTV